MASTHFLGLCLLILNYNTQGQWMNPTSKACLDLKIRKDPSHQYTSFAMKFWKWGQKKLKKKLKFYYQGAVIPLLLCGFSVVVWVCFFFLRISYIFLKKNISFIL